jgi:hypothetical protein
VLFFGIGIVERDGCLVRSCSFLLLRDLLICDTQSCMKAVGNFFNAVIFVLDLEAVVLDVGSERTLELLHIDVSRRQWLSFSYREER